MRYCTKCGTKVPDGVLRFCKTCGNALQHGQNTNETRGSEQIKAQMDAVARLRNAAVYPRRGRRNPTNVWIIVAVIGLVCAAIVIVVATTPGHANHFKTGKSRFEAANYDEAVKYFSKAIKSKPLAEYYHYRGCAFDSGGEYGKALADYSEAIRLNPQEVSYYFDRGNVYDAQKNYRRAAADYTETIRLVPDEARYYNHRGNSRRLLEDYDNAIADYTQAIRLNPDDPRYRNNRGVSYLLKRDYDNAIANYTEAIRLAPDNARYYHNRGGAYNLKKDFAKAAENFGEAVRLDPDNGKYIGDLEKAESDWAARGGGAAVRSEQAYDLSLFTDSRDGQSYRTVRIGGKTWMAENLNYAADESYCYGNSESNCRKYGRLYDWYTAEEACPAGWHLPSRHESDVLVQTVGEDAAGRRLKSSTQWDGTNDFGFSILPSGLLGRNGNFINIGEYGYWWTSTEGGSDDVYYRYVISDNTRVHELQGKKSSALSVRCVKD